MKTLKFRPALAQLITEGKKTTTWRLFDDKDLQAGDTVELMNSETKEVFGRAVITEVDEKSIKDLDAYDWEGHERFPSDEAMYTAYRTYYPGKEIGPDTIVKVLHFTPQVNDKKAQTISTYDHSAKQLADKFDSLGARIADIEETFALVEKENPKVLEIGCGNGRDAAEILKRTNDYIGVDISEELIKLARQKVPQAKFEVADITDFSLPERVDIVFAFASLIHLNKEDFAMVLDKIFNSLNPGGAVRISLKHSDVYKEVTKEDEFGVRTYYHYSQGDMAKLAKNFAFIKNELNDLRGQKWLEILLQKRSERV